MLHLNTQKQLHFQINAMSYFAENPNPSSIQLLISICSKKLWTEILCPRQHLLRLHCKPSRMNLGSAPSHQLPEITKTPCLLRPDEWICCSPWWMLKVAGMLLNKEVLGTVSSTSLTKWLNANFSFCSLPSGRSLAVPQEDTTTSSVNPSACHCNSKLWSFS